MPRIDGVSWSSTEWLIRRRPMPLTMLACFGRTRSPFTSVTLTRFVSAISSLLFSPYWNSSIRVFVLLLNRRHLFEVLAAQACHRRRFLQALEPVEGRAHDVVWIRRSERLGQHVVQPRRFDDGAHRAAAMMPVPSGAGFSARPGRICRRPSGGWSCPPAARESGPSGRFDALLMADGTLRLAHAEADDPWPSPTTTSAS